MKIEGVFSYDASEGNWVNRKLGVNKDGYMEFTKYATFQPAEGSYGSFYMNNPNYTGKYILGNPWYDKDETIGNTFSNNAA